MRVLGSKKKWVTATVGVVVVGTLASLALANHLPFNFTTTPVATGNLISDVKQNSDRVKFQTKDPTDVRVARIDIAPGGRSGWHHHPGIVIVTVAQGAVTFTHSDCTSKTYGPGQPDGAVFVEGGDEPPRPRIKAPLRRPPTRRSLRRTTPRPSSESTTTSSPAARDNTSPADSSDLDP